VNSRHGPMSRLDPCESQSRCRSSQSATSRPRNDSNFGSGFSRRCRYGGGPANPMRFQLHATTQSFTIHSLTQIDLQLTQRDCSDSRLISSFTLVLLHHIALLNAKHEAVLTIAASPTTLRTPRTPLNTPWSTEIPARLSG
jgi:hypothetical protein